MNFVIPQKKQEARNQNATFGILINKTLTFSFFVEF
jgi:hypothetical protein